MGEMNLLRAIPKVDELLRRPELSALEMPASTLREAVRAELSALREAVLSGEMKELPDAGEICANIRARAEEAELPSLRGVINATGVVLHANLGRACLRAPACALSALSWERARASWCAPSCAHLPHPLQTRPGVPLTFMGPGRSRPCAGSSLWRR